MPARSITIIGCGDLGRRVAALHQTRGDRVFGLVRSQDSAAELAAAGIHALRANLDDPASLAKLPKLTTELYWFAPPPATGISDPRIDAFLASSTPPPLPAKVVYVSTTGVYGDAGGRWIDETQPTAPGTDRGKRRLWAEQRLSAWYAAWHIPVVILRVAGIYGPGRLPTDRLRQGLPVVREAEAPFTNRIHVDDLARVCVAAMLRGQHGKVYNATDGTPGTMTDYFYRMADLLGLPRPPSVSLAEARQVLSPTMASYLGESRRISNHKMLDELGVELHYPNLQSGLASCLPATSQREH